MKVLIVDDEAPARERLGRLVEEIEGYEVAGEAANGELALDFCASHAPDVLLLDIRMPGMDGVETARHLLAMESPPAVIFTTAYDEYALQAFDAEAIGYLLKPIRKEKLEQALHRAARLTRPQLAAAGGDGDARTRICVRVREGLRMIAIDNIACFRAEQKYVVVYHDDGEVLIDEPLKDLEKEFADSFVRIHRNALVAVSRLASVRKDTDGGYVAVVQGMPNALAVSRRLAPALRKRLKSGDIA
ncbi:MAG: response regulator transcription factor [Gammaproteobacteria bacterium]|nr:response regulator transcription factor [Gammaproteobacteria bacterium]